MLQQVTLWILVIPSALAVSSMLCILVLLGTRALMRPIVRYAEQRKREEEVRPDLLMVDATHLGNCLRRVVESFPLEDSTDHALGQQLQAAVRRANLTGHLTSNHHG